MLSVHKKTDYAFNPFRNRTVPFGDENQCREPAGSECWTTFNPRCPAQKTPGGWLDHKHMLPADLWLAHHHVMKINSDY